MTELEKVKEKIKQVFEKHWKNFKETGEEPLLIIMEEDILGVLGEWQKQLGELLIDKRPKVEIRGENITWEDVYEWQKQLQKLIFGVEVERELGLK